MYFVSPKDIERYWLRTLLLYVRGAKSFEDVRTYEGIRYNSFTEAARARNLMVDDNEWDNCLTEAVNLKFPKELCRLFAYICVFGLPANAIDLWNKYKDDMIFDNNLPAEVSIQKSLILINEVLNFHGFSLHQFGLPNIDQKLLEQYNSVDTENNALALKLLKEESNILIESLNNEQRQVFDDVLMAVYDDNCENRYIYLDGPGGSGKSYLHNTIITTVESQGLIVLSVAWTGIAANLLKGGRTSHNMFKFPIPINEDSKCNISGMSKHAEIFRKAKIIIWDEITMAPKYALQAMECMLRDITKCSKPFGGKVILLSGDFRQTLPIVPHGNRTHIVEVCVKNSRLWQHFESRSLHANVRLNNDQIEFSNWLLNVGDGKPTSSFEKENNVLEIPKDLISNGNLIDEIYGSSISPNDSSVYSSCILSLTNAEVLDMNECILSRLEAEEVVYYSNDSHVDDDNPENLNNLIPIEFLNSLTPDGLPPHKLPLKVGCIIMLLRNLNLAQGLCNGTRLVVKSLLQNVILAEIISGKSDGEVVFIPRIDLSPSQDAPPFKMVRRQFPIRLAYAMTINKSQGQLFDKVGIYLPISAFGHGQVYVGGSRVKSKENLKILAVSSAVYKNLEYPEKLYVKNIVYHEIL
ncbi:ATP-dependent DNA helicase pif1-like [Leptopilina heterotoma]|uniref:ATP-dependent DNA helicase pif1-like n=1 Tax=Leptopilina heterotoma TaxID=63436 RepID=UPI001CA89E1C|nr:ATP-dependent DNA helicase pif1-like [Leptopilina heterotoma]